MRPSVLFAALAPLLAPTGSAAPLPTTSGIWSLQAGFSAPPGTGEPLPTAELIISGDRVRGHLGCGRFEGSLNTGERAHQVSFSLRPLPPRPTERCRYAAQNPLVAALNGATRYATSQRQLLIFSGKARLVFGRVGFVTPVRP